MTLRFDLENVVLRASVLVFAFLSALFVGLSICGSGVFAQEKSAEPLTANPSQELMLLRNHLSSIKKPTKLKYSFERKSQKKGDSFSDTIDVNVTELAEDGTKNLKYDFFTGARKRPYPDGKRFESNGLIMVSLTRDVWQMAREIGKHAQQANYFSKRINFALRKKPILEDVTVDRGNGPEKAKRITLKPFVGDYHIDKFKKFEQKIYEITFMENIPGELYMFRTYIPAGEAAKESGPSIEEITKFVGSEPLQ